MLDDLHAQSYGYFQQEAPELLQTLEHELLNLGGQWSVNKAHTLMRTTHTLKGAAASVGLEGVKSIAHRLEDLFRGLCQPDIVPDRELESLLFEGFECLRQPLSAQLSDNPVAIAPYLEQVETILSRVQAKLGDAFQQDAGIPTAAELGFDLTLSIFESGVSQRLDALRAALASQSPGLSDLLSTHASIFQGLAESLALPGFRAIADAVIAAVANHPEQSTTIATLALADWQAGHQAVLSGDRDQGGTPSPDLLAIASGGEALTDNVTDDFWAINDWQDDSLPPADFWATAEASADNTEALPDGFWVAATGSDVSLEEALPPDDFWRAPTETPPDDFWGAVEPEPIAAPPADFWDDLTTVEVTPESETDLSELSDGDFADSNFPGSDFLPETGNTLDDDFWGAAAFTGADQAAIPAADPELEPDLDWLTEADSAEVELSKASTASANDTNLFELDGLAVSESEFDLTPETNLWDSLDDFDLDSATAPVSEASAAAELALPNTLANVTESQESLATEIDSDSAPDLEDSFWAQMDSLVEQATQAAVPELTDPAPESTTDDFWATLEPDSSADVLSSFTEPEPAPILPPSDFWGDLTPPGEPEPLVLANLWAEIEAPPTQDPKPVAPKAKPAAAKVVPAKPEPPKQQPALIAKQRPSAPAKASSPPKAPPQGHAKVSPKPKAVDKAPAPTQAAPAQSAAAPKPAPAPSAPAKPASTPKQVAAKPAPKLKAASLPEMPVVATAVTPPSAPSQPAFPMPVMPEVAIAAEVPIAFNPPPPAAPQRDQSQNQSGATNSGLGSTVAAIAALKAQTSNQLPIQIASTPVAPPPKAPQAPTATVRINVNHLESLGTSLAELLTNQNRQSLQDEQLQNAVQMLHYRLQQHKTLLVQLREWSDQQLIHPSLPMAGGLEWQRQFDSLELDHYNDLQVLAQTIFEDTVQLEEATDAVDIFARQLSITRDKQQRLLGTTRDVLMEARLLPLQDVLGRFERVLQQLETRHEKPVQLVVRGGDVMIDKTVAEKLYDPLLHIVRNAFDHGLETPSERAKVHKSAKGQITIRAHHRGTNLFIDVSDDGKGLDYARIRQKAIAQKRVTAAQAQSLDQDSLTQFLFEPGFSTAATVSDLSGRGVGLDVVKTQLEALQGDVSIQSRPGQGTTFRLQIPLNLTIVQLLLCEVGETPYALLADQVEHILNPKPTQILQRGGDRLLRWGSSGSETLVPLRRLSQLLDYRSLQPASQSHSDQRAIILLRLGDNLMGLEVDQVLREQELVVRPFSTLVRPPDYVAGGSILADGRLTLVLDSISLLRSMIVHSASPIDPSADVPVMAKTPAVLVVEDSVTVRQTLTASLQRAGYTVIQARDGQEAAELLNQADTPIQLIVSDVEMPRMNGFELLNFRQGQPRLQAIPMMMLTSRSSTKHQQLALGLGANAYLTKPYLEQQLLNQVAELLA